MKKDQNLYAKCKCCNVLKDKYDVSNCLTILKNTDFMKAYGMNSDLFDYLLSSNFEWVCDKCLEDKYAITASPFLQVDTLNPHLAYYDVSLNCKKCGEDFKFTKEEKKFWYEDLKFFRESVPVNCLKCRKEIRILKSQNKVLSQVLKKDVNEMSLDELSQIAKIYDEWDKKDKLNFYNKVIETRLK